VCCGVVLVVGVCFGVVVVVVVLGVWGLLVRFCGVDGGRCCLVWLLYWCGGLVVCVGVVLW
jgi:hypothetical protein